MVILISDRQSGDLGGGAAQELGEALAREGIVVYYIHVAEGAPQEETFTLASLTGGQAFAAGDPAALREVIAGFPPGALQLEVGIQTFNEDVSKLISRRQNYERLADNLRFLREHTGVHVHADLIAGLPGESRKALGRASTGWSRSCPRKSRWAS